jgi:hypothetical protein
MSAAPGENALGLGGLLHGSECNSREGWVCNCAAPELPLTDVECDGCRRLRDALGALLNESRGMFRSPSY